MPDLDAELERDCGMTPERRIARLPPPTGPPEEQCGRIRHALDAFVSFDIDAKLTVATSRACDKLNRRSARPDAETPARRRQRFNMREERAGQGVGGDVSLAIHGKVEAVGPPSLALIQCRIPTGHRLGGRRCNRHPPEQHTVVQDVVWSRNPRDC